MNARNRRGDCLGNGRKPWRRTSADGGAPHPRREEGLCHGAQRGGAARFTRRANRKVAARSDLCGSGPRDRRSCLIRRARVQPRGRGTFQLLQRLAPTLAKNGGGAVVNIASGAGLTNVPFNPTYSASKVALHFPTQAARILLEAHGTSAFGVYAGSNDTYMTGGPRDAKTSPSEVAGAILDGSKAGREDIYPDPFSVKCHRVFESSPKASEHQFAAMVSAAA